MEINSLIKDRKSIRAFSDKEIEQEKLELLFEAARWAPSSMNEQPWRFVYVTKNDSNYEHIFSTLADSNKEWAIVAPVLIVAIAKNNFQYKDRANLHYMYDLGQAVANLSIQATELGLFLHQMGGVDFIKLKENLSVPDGYTISTVIAVGYQGELSMLSEKLIERELAVRIRKPLSEVVNRDFFNFD